MTSQDVIEIRALQVLAICGVLDQEQLNPQPFSIDIDLYLDLSTAGTSDDLADTVDYGALVDRVCELADSEKFLLLETFAEAIAKLALTDSKTERADVAVHKLRPPVSASLVSSGVRISRIRK